VGLERGPLSLVSTNEELLEWKSSGSGSRKPRNSRGDPLRWPRDTLYPHKLALTSPTSGGRSVGIVISRTKATEFVLWGESACTWCVGHYLAYCTNSGWQISMEDTVSSGIRIGRGNRSIRRKPLCPPQITPWPDLGSNLGPEVGNRRAISWAMEQPQCPLYIY
jgi:hypothetical protein